MVLSRVDLGRLIRARRQILGISTRAVAEAVGVPVEHVGQWERGLRSIPPARLAALEQILSAEPGTFLEPRAAVERSVTVQVAHDAPETTTAAIVRIARSWATIEANANDWRVRRLLTHLRMVLDRLDARSLPEAHAPASGRSANAR